MGFQEERRLLVESLKRKGFITGRTVEEAMLRVPRELFLPDAMRDMAYKDMPLPIGKGQTISAPHMVAMMVDLADLAPGMKVLEVGAGSGYHAAVMAEMVRPDGKIFTIERIEDLAIMAKENLHRAGYDDTVEVIVGDGTLGHAQKAPYDRITVAAAAPYVPRSLKDQLADGGILLIPVGGQLYQELKALSRKGDRFEERDLGGCVFVPLIGKEGHRE